jgi:hypothetical protein
MGTCKTSKIGDIWIKSHFILICGYLFVIGNHNKTENEILSFKTLLVNYFTDVTENEFLARNR